VKGIQSITAEEVVRLFEADVKARKRLARAVLLHRVEEPNSYLQEFHK
jgi:hypothetical protein